MFRSLPVTALRTFESAARHLSFKAAAEELAVTATAVSHQIRSLEEWLGCALFVRTGRGVLLTEAGRRLFLGVHDGLMGLAQATTDLRPSLQATQLTVTLPPSFAALWLIPRLERFYQAYPDIQLRLDTTANLVDLTKDTSIDIALRYGAGDHPGLVKAAQLDEIFGVYAAPSWFAKSELPPTTLISIEWGKSSMYASSWHHWCEKAHVDWDQQPSTRMRAYTEEVYAFQAAIAGQGLVLASSILIADSVINGLLRSFLPEVTVSGGSYAALCIPGRERHPPVRAFLRWLRHEWQPSETNINPAK